MLEVQMKSFFVPLFLFLPSLHPLWEMGICLYDITVFCSFMSVYINNMSCEYTYDVYPTQWIILQVHFVI